MIFADLKIWHGKFGVSAFTALSSTYDERGPLDIDKQLTSTSIGTPPAVLS
jgi:hypothetical protein